MQLHVLYLFEHTRLSLEQGIDRGIRYRHFSACDIEYKTSGHKIEFPMCFFITVTEIFIGSLKILPHLHAFCI